jgi:hypothetical protein
LVSLNFIFLLFCASLVSSATIIFASLFFDPKETFDVILTICHQYLRVIFNGIAFFVFMLQSAL